ncbi:RHS repeat-associated core domain-containing protein [Burkholderia sp. IDO3]|uniref:RHS repeat-associated core domain-containing protein n=1 Tax=Burkholderia sp. IDO3 TaxID=1705310 RepID=UPI001F08195B|nr:RHS repeat-associated core domain-containing protein [Burkholderia sp. IDO3]
MTGTATPTTPQRPIPKDLRQNAEARRVIVSPFPATETSPRLTAAGAESVRDHSREIFVQCLYMVPFAGNAMSLYDVGVDIYRICSEPGGTKKVINWGILAIDAIGVVPAAGNATRPARAVVKEVLLAFAKGAGAAVLVDLFWATAGGDVLAFMAELDTHLRQWKGDIVKSVREASRTVRRFVLNPVSTAEQMGRIRKNTGFLSWVPSTEEIALVGIDQLLRLSGQRDAIVAWLDEFDRQTESMLSAAFGSVEEAGSLLFMAAQIAVEIKTRKARQIPSHVAQATPGTMREPHRKPGEHRDSTQKGAMPSPLPAKDGCGCPQTASAKPVNYAMGDENLEQTDFVLDAVVPIVWKRRYRSSLAAYDASPLGARWSSPYHLSLEERDGALTFFDPDGRAVPLPPVATGESVDVPTEQFTVGRPDARHVLLAYPDGSRERYERHGTAMRVRYRLVSRTNRDGLGLGFTYNAANELVMIGDDAGNAIHIDYVDGRVSAIYRSGVPGLVTEALARYAYSAEGDLIGHVDMLGFRRTYTYEQHLLTRYTDFNRHAANLAWDWPGRREGMPARSDAKCVRTWFGNEDQPPQDDTHFAYHREHWYTVVTDADGHATIHRYDSDNRIVLVEHADGSSDAYEWDERNRLVGTKNALGYTQRFAYDAHGRLTTETDALGNTTRTEYDENGRPVQVTAPDGRITQTAYDALGRPVSVTDASGRTTRYAWGAQSELLSLTDPKGGVQRFRYDHALRLTEATDCSGHTTRYGYDERGHLSRIADAEGHITRYRCDARGQFVSVAYPDGTEEHFTWDGEGNLQTYRDGAGQLTEYTFNARRQPTWRKDAAGRELAYGYDRQWRLDRLTNENGDQTRFGYDPLSRLIEQRDFDGSTTYYRWDDAGQLIGSQAGDIETTYTRDPLGRLTRRETKGAGGRGQVIEHFYYDARGRLMTAQGFGSRVYLHYDDADNLIAEEQTVRPDIDGEYTSVTRHEYDALGNRTRTHLPNTRTIDWLRYGSGHLHGVLLDGQPLADFERDKLHREIVRRYRGFEQTREYDPAGRLQRMIVRRDVNARLADWIAGRRFQYDAAGQLMRIEDRARGVTDYTYDPTGRLLRATTLDLTEVFAFDPAGNPVDPDKIPPRPTDEPVESVMGRMQRQMAQDRAWWEAHPGERLPEAQLARRMELASECEVWRNWEKALPKCVGNVLKELNRTRYEHDAHGNLVRKREPGGVTWLYEYDAAHRLSLAKRYAKPPAAHEVDRIERTKSGTAWIPGTVKPELHVRFSYDAFGRRTVKEVARKDRSIERTVFTWDGDVLLMEERFHIFPLQPGEHEPMTSRPPQLVREEPDDAYSVPVAQRAHTFREQCQWQGASLYLHEPGTFVPLARLDEMLVEAPFVTTDANGRFVQVPAKTRHATLFYQNDHLGTPQELLDESGKVVWLGRYRAWGGETTTVWRETPERYDTGNAIRFQGQYRDEETGLHYNRYRYYDPDSGRFISKDPIGLQGGLNTYQYAPNGTEWIDPLGLAGNRANRRAGNILQDIDAKGGGHAYSRHGAGTTLAQQEHRAVTGIPPDCPCLKRPRPTDSTRFVSNVDQLDAIQRGTAKMNASGESSITFDMGRTVGEGYRKGGGPVLSASDVTIVRRDGSIVTAFPKLPSL